MLNTVMYIGGPVIRTHDNFLSGRFTHYYHVIFKIIAFFIYLIYILHRAAKSQSPLSNWRSFLLGRTAT